MKGGKIMKIVKAGIEIIDSLNGLDVIKKIERCGRVCYKSEEKITEDSAVKFVQKILQSGHESVLEHFSFTVKFICDRGVSHEIVRHRIASYSQESTRYCNYGKDQFARQVTFIQPCWFENNVTGIYEDELSKYETYQWVDLPEQAWMLAMAEAEDAYLTLLGFGWSPQQARSVLPNSLKTEVVMTANIREWRHFLKLRTSPAAHPQMQEVAKMLLLEMRKIPVLFDDIEL
jgi:thymidylate synthase (FAD)